MREVKLYDSNVFSGSFKGVEKADVDKPLFEKVGQYETVANGTIIEFKLLIPRDSEVSFFPLNRRGIDSDDENVDLLVIQKEIDRGALPTGAQARKTWVYKVNYGNAMFPSCVKKIYEWPKRI